MATSKTPMLELDARPGVCFYEEAYNFSLSAPRPAPGQTCSRLAKDVEMV